MSAAEFDLIKQYFNLPDHRSDVVLGGGDDCAIVCAGLDTTLNTDSNTDPGTGQAGASVCARIAVTTDTLIAGTHFPVTTSAADIASKAIAVNLSDLAAMGAQPAWITLALTLPEIDHAWLTAFSTQFQQTLEEYNVALIGGDTTRGSLSITLQAMGLLTTGRAMRRSQAKPGDRIFVTGTLGDAAVGLRCLQEKRTDPQLNYCIDRLNRPQPRTRFAMALLAYCDCAIDISDGLLADLGHILSASDCGARIRTKSIPLSESLHYYFDNYNHQQVDWNLVLTQGDDYELCFTLAEGKVDAVMALAMSHQLAIHCIGEISADKSFLCHDEQGNVMSLSTTGYSHF